MSELQAEDLKKELDFEKERLLNLIDSKVRRREMDTAKRLAEELFKTIMEFLLLEKAKRLRRYNKLLLKTLCLLMACLITSIVCAVMDIQPFLNLGIQIIVIVAILSVIVVNNSLCRKFGSAVQKIVERYETVRQSFIEKLLDNFLTNSSPDMTLRSFSLLVFS